MTAHKTAKLILNKNIVSDALKQVKIVKLLMKM